MTPPPPGSISIDKKILDEVTASKGAVTNAAAALARSLEQSALTAAQSRHAAALKALDDAAEQAVGP